MVEPTPQSYDLDVDEIFDALSSRRRRVVLRQLLLRRHAVVGELVGQLPPVTVEELADSVARAESTDRAPPEELRNGIVTRLHHVDLPKLARSELIDFDAERGSITTREAAHAVEPYLELARADEGPGSGDSSFRR